MAKLKDPIQTHWRDGNPPPVGQLNWFGDGNRSSRSPVNRYNGFKGLYKTYFASLVGLWHGLTVPQQDAWTTFSQSNPITDRYGQSIEIGGFQWFMKLNTFLLQAEESSLTSPPGTATPSYTPTFSVALNGGTGDAEVTPSPSPGAGEYFFIARSINRPLSQVAPVNTFKTQGFANSSDSFPFVVALASELESGAKRHKFRFKAGDANGLSDSLVYDDILTGTTP